MSVPAISVVVPTYQRPQLLERALKSIGEATTATHEIIVIDDSPDGSGFEAARRYGAKYVFKAGKHRGSSASRNIGLKLATGEFLAFLDDDDFFNPGGLDALLQAARNGAGDGDRLVFGDHSNFSSELRTRVVLAGLTMDHLLVCNRIVMGSFLLRRSSLEGGFDLSMRSHEDWEFILRHAQSQALHHVPLDIVCVDKTANTTTSTEALIDRCCLEMSNRHQSARRRRSHPVRTR
jgi:glycosyltransferase involved in cell wall biosynthesis